MTKTKKLIIICISLLICGCTGKYSLTINGDKFDESIIANIYSSDHIPRQMEDEKLDMAEQFINSDFYAFYDNYEILYNKKIIDKGDYKNVILDYSFNRDNFINSYYINNCFEKKNVKLTKDKYSFDLSGYFYCLYDGNLQIEIKTNNKVLSNNADKIKKNKYIWYINKENFQNISIKFDISSTKQKNLRFIVFIFTIVITIILVLLLLFFKKLKNNNSI